MESIRITQKPVKSRITFSLPASFGDDEVEIIILPLEKKIRMSEDDRRQNLRRRNRLIPHPVMSRINIKYDPTEALDQSEWPEAE